jgi:lipoprotein-releasing system ATP-binding protein
MAEPLLVIEHVVRDYGKKMLTRALDGVDMVLEKGEFVALIGPSGSGKSTLLNIIGLLDRPTSGRVLVDGRDTTGLDELALTRLRARTLGFVFQFHHLLPAFTALENVLLPAWGDEGAPSPEVRTSAQRLLEAVGLAHRMHFRANELSGGEQQRVAVARALSRQPKLLLADEPTGNLDTKSSNEVFALLRRFNRELGTTCLIVTHDNRIAESCDRIIEIADGRVRAQAPRG